MSRVGQPVFITRPPAISPVVTSTQAQGASVNPNQAAMSQIINQLNQSQVQLSAAAAQTSAQRSLFVSQTATMRRAK
jgi:phage-related tail protein